MNWNPLKWFTPKPRPVRVDLKFVPYYPDGDELCKQGWTIAPEEDRNRQLGYVFLEKLEYPNK